MEDHLTGEEISLLAVCGGERVIPMAAAQDYKRIGDGDRARTGRDGRLFTGSGLGGAALLEMVEMSVSRSSIAAAAGCRFTGCSSSG